MDSCFLKLAFCKEQRGSREKFQQRREKHVREGGVTQSFEGLLGDVCFKTLWPSRVAFRNVSTYMTREGFIRRRVSISRFLTVCSKATLGEKSMARGPISLYSCTRSGTEVKVRCERAISDNIVFSGYWWMHFYAVFKGLRIHVVPQKNADFPAQNSRFLNFREFRRVGTIFQLGWPRAHLPSE